MIDYPSDISYQIFIQHQPQIANKVLKLGSQVLNELFLSSPRNVYWLLSRQPILPGCDTKLFHDGTERVPQFQTCLITVNWNGCFAPTSHTLRGLLCSPFWNISSPKIGSSRCRVCSITCNRHQHNNINKMLQPIGTQRPYNIACLDLSQSHVTRFVSFSSAARNEVTTNVCLTTVNHQ